MKKILLALLFVSTLSFADSHCDTFFGSGCSGSEIKISVPGIVDNSGFVPVNINFDTSVENGEVINILANGNLAYKIVLSGNVVIDKFSGRIRAVENSGNVKVEVERYTGKVGTNSESFKNSIPYRIENTSSKTKKHKLKSKSGTIKFLYRNKMGAQDFIEKVVLDTSDGGIVVSMTPYASGEDGTTHEVSIGNKMVNMPLSGYFSIDGKFGKAKVEKIKLYSE